MGARRSTAAQATRSRAERDRRRLSRVCGAPMNPDGLSPHLFFSLVFLNPVAAEAITRHTSHITRHTSHVTHHTSHITRHTSHITHHTSHVTRHTSHVTHHTSHITHHTSHITHHTSHITHHKSHITHHTSHITHHTSPGSATVHQHQFRSMSQSSAAASAYAARQPCPPHTHADNWRKEGQRGREGRKMLGLE